MLRKLLPALRHVLLDLDFPTCARLILATQAALWALLFAQAHPLLSHEQYALILALFPASVWSAIFLTASVYHLICALLLPPVSHHLFYSLLNLALWGYVTLALAFSTWPPPLATLGAFSMAALSFWFVLKEADHD